MKRVFLVSIIIFSLIGLIYIFNSFQTVTGLSIVENTDTHHSGIAGIVFLGAGFSFLYLGRKKKGQAAMEFLMTYGWAILAAIIAIGVLAYFGVFNPGRLTGAAILVAPPFNVEDTNIVNDGGGPGQDRINFLVTQNMGFSMTLEPNTGTADGFEVTLPDGTACVEDESAGLPNIIDPTSPESWISGTQIVITADCGDKWSPSDAVRGDIIIRYKKESSSLVQISQGNFRANSQ